MLLLLLPCETSSVQDNAAFPSQGRSRCLRLFHHATLMRHVRQREPGWSMAMLPGHTACPPHLHLFSLGVREPLCQVIQLPRVHKHTLIPSLGPAVKLPFKSRTCLSLPPLTLILADLVQTGFFTVPQSWTK